MRKLSEMKSLLFQVSKMIKTKLFSSLAGDHVTCDDHEALLQVRGELPGPAAQHPQHHRDHADQEASGGPGDTEDSPGRGVRVVHADEQGVCQVLNQSIMNYSRRIPSEAC